MGSEKAREYEHFIRGAFEKSLNQSIERRRDPAGLADADTFKTQNINRVKAAVAYAMEIFNYEIFEENDLSDEEYNLMNELVTNIIEAGELNTISDTIDKYKAVFFKKYLN